MSVVLTPGNPVSLVAAGDLTGSKFRFVKLDTNGDAVAIAAITDIPFGVLQNAPALGEPASVIPIGCGGSKVALGATLAPGARIACGATGLAVAAAATSYPCGQLTEGGASGDAGAALLTPLTVQA